MFINSICSVYLEETMYIKSTKSNFALYSLYYAEACNRFTGLISSSLRPCKTASFEEMAQRGNFDHTKIKPRRTALETNAIPFDQLCKAMQQLRI